jgi:putative DNA primase/helicase
MSYTYSSKANPCPICDRTKDQDCRFNDEIVLCHTYNDADAQQDGYVYRGATDCGTWGQHFPVETERFGDKQIYKKAVRPQAQKEFVYQGSDGQPVVKITRKDNGAGKKNFYQSHFKDGQWLPKFPETERSRLHLYRIFDDINQQAIADNQLVFVVEGEGVADSLIALGIAATTAIGGAGKWKHYGYPNYVSDLKDARVVICPDCDIAGIKHTEAIGSDFPEARWLYAIPESPSWNNLPPKGGLDVADWINALKAEGLSVEQVRSLILAAVEPRRSNNAVQDELASQATSPMGDDSKSSRFKSSPDGGLVWISFEKDSESGEFKESKKRIGGHLSAVAYVDNVEGDGASLLMEFKTIRNQIRRWVMPRSELAGDASGLLGELLKRGYAYEPNEFKHLKRYLLKLGSDVRQTYTVADRTGWVDDSFAIENRTYGDESIRFRDVEPVKDSAYEMRGTADSWKTEVASLAANNSRLIFGIGCAFAAPLAHVLEIESGGFHVFGATSTGKTTTLRIAASVVGIPSKAVKLWRATANGLEGLAVAHNHLLMPLDEIGQADPKDVGQAAYMLANGQGKTRARRNGDATPAKTWNTLFLSSGEVGLTHYLRAAGIAVKGGQEIRMPDIPACPQNGFGAFESISTFPKPEDFVHALESAVERNCGTALDAFLTQLVSDARSPDWIKVQGKRLWEIANRLKSAAPTEEAIGRVALRFALVQVALEVAHGYGLLPFGVEQCGWSVRTMFDGWMDARGGSGSIEIKQAMERIEHLFVSNEYGDRIHRVDEPRRSDGKPLIEEAKVRNLLAHKKHDELEGDDEFWVPSAVFAAEIAKDVDRAALTQELQARGWLKPAGSDGKSALRRRLGGKLSRFYVFRPFWKRSESEEKFPEVKKRGVTGITEAQDLDLEKVSLMTPSVTPLKSEVSQVSQHIEDNLFEIDNPLIDAMVAVTPVTPQKNEVSQPQKNESINATGFHGGVTPVTPVTPQIHQSLKKVLALVSEEELKDEI